jgi:hypothetical protein
VKIVYAQGYGNKCNLSVKLVPMCVTAICPLLFVKLGNEPVLSDSNSDQFLVWRKYIYHSFSLVLLFFLLKLSVASWVYAKNGSRIIVREATFCVQFCSSMSGFWETSSCPGAPPRSPHPSPWRAETHGIERIVSVFNSGRQPLSHPRASSMQLTSWASSHV